VSMGYLLSALSSANAGLQVPREKQLQVKQPAPGALFALGLQRHHLLNITNGLRFRIC
jgi:hypothetical protein